METLNNQHLSNEIKINIINKINILIDKIDHLEYNDNLTKIQKTYMIMLESTRKFLDDIRNQNCIYKDYSDLNKYIQNKNSEIDEFISNVERINTYT
tara:strand:+ start:3105 stop:3395 length:291 start_codon:yes stop_codon:yes gene_type:complete